MNFSYRLGWLFFRCLYATYFRWRVFNAERVPPSGPVILASNHASFLDPPLVGSGVTRGCNYLARESLFRYPGVGALLRSWQAVPVDRNSGYSRQEVWLDKTELRAVKVDYFNRRGDHLKTLISSDFKEYLGRYWYPDRQLMTNHQSGRSTLLEYKNYRFRNGFTGREFDQASLEGAR